MVPGYPTSTNLPRVDGLSTDPWDLGCHKSGEDLGKFGQRCAGKLGRSCKDVRAESKS